jgi:hypothetical protein
LEKEEREKIEREKKEREIRREMAAEERKAVEDKIRKEEEEKIKAAAAATPSIEPAIKPPSAEDASEKPMQPTPPESVADSWEKASADCAEAAEAVVEQQ